ncbi:MAG: hypothetical protein ACJ72Y_07190 [Actinomycetes bacterium]
MNVLSRLDQLLAVTSAVERRGRSDELVAEIADALATAGEYVTRIDLLPTQTVLDFNWAAHQAGRQVGLRIRVDVRVDRGAADGRAQVRVTPQRAPD